jgi:hypothetical protein
MTYLSGAIRPLTLVIVPRGVVISRRAGASKQKSGGATHPGTSRHYARRASPGKQAPAVAAWQSPQGNEM